ncbi:TPA: hypothetical protein ACH3X1_000791 [Trebouxia sp. C0004]
MEVVTSDGSSTGSWEIDAAHPDISSSPTSQMAATHVSSRQQSVTSTGGHDVQDASEVRQGIELRPAKANVLLGQYHMERSGQFVSAKPGRNMGPDLHCNLSGYKLRGSNAYQDWSIMSCPADLEVVLCSDNAGEEELIDRLSTT